MRGSYENWNALCLIRLTPLVGEEKVFWRISRSVSMKLKIFSWNVRGMNEGDKRRIIKSMIRSYSADLVCLKETKMQQMNDSLPGEEFGCGEVFGLGGQWRLGVKGYLGSLGQSGFGAY